MKLFVAGMNCGHCVKTITRALQARDPAARVTVDLVAGTVSIDTAIDGDAAAAAVVQAGYTVTAVEAGGPSSRRAP